MIKRIMCITLISAVLWLGASRVSAAGFSTGNTGTSGMTGTSGTTGTADTSGAAGAGYNSYQYYNPQSYGQGGANQYQGYNQGINQNFNQGYNQNYSPNYNQGGPMYGNPFQNQNWQGYYGGYGYQYPYQPMGQQQPGSGGDITVIGGIPVSLNDQNQNSQREQSGIYLYQDNNELWLVLGNIRAKLETMIYQAPKVDMVGATNDKNNLNQR